MTARSKIHFKDMASRGLCVTLTLFLLLLQLHDSVAEGVSPAHDGSKGNSIQHEASQLADDNLCLKGNAITISRKLAERFQQDAVLSMEDFRQLLADMTNGLSHYAADDFKKHCSDSNMELEVEINGRTVNCSGLLIECPGLEAIYRSHSDDQSGLNYSHVAEALQEAALSLTNPLCRSALDPLHHKNKPTVGQVWGYSLGFVTLVVIISNIGGLLTPLMSKTFFQRLLQFLVAMGAGTLVATGLLILLPEAFDIVSIEELSDDFIWKSATALFSIYVFFVSERFLKFLLKSREVKNLRRHNKSLHIRPSSDEENNDKLPMTSSSQENGLQSEPESDHGHSHFVTPPKGTEGGESKSKGPVSTLAWLVLIGDIIHNFVDGMAIGAGFTENVFLGITIGIAVLCEELPHELGDVAILLHSGMTMKRALFLNFLSACVCYVGLVLGIILGESTEATRWILALAGGLFLYVPLVDMLPDMSQHLDMKVREGLMSQGKGKGAISREAWLILGCQSLGLFVGICIILTVVNLTRMIELN